MFTFSYDIENDSVSLVFKNEILEIDCSPECFYELVEDGYDSAPSNGEFHFYYDDTSITFNVGKYGDGQGGCLTIVLEMTKEIRESLEKAITEWRALISKNLDDEE